MRKKLGYFFCLRNCVVMYSKLRYLSIPFVIFFLVAIILYSYTYQPKGDSFLRRIAKSDNNFYRRTDSLSSEFIVSSYLEGKPISFEHPDSRVLSRYAVNLNADDVLVFLHIQKTGGSSFGRHLVRHIKDFPCKCRKKRKRCRCKNSGNNNWLVSRYSTGWMCGLHADWTELQACVDGKLREKDADETRRRRYFYITMLRDPVSRYLSEWNHVRRGATWSKALLMCNGKPANLPKCYSGEDWAGVSLTEFATCPYNLGANRQTRMIANLSYVSCYNTTLMSTTERNAKLLKSALHNLHDMTFVGLVEYQILSEYLFTRTFNLTFTTLFWQQQVTVSSFNNLTYEDKRTVVSVNQLDIQLYQNTLDFFFLRLRYCMLNDPLLPPLFKDSIRLLSGPSLVKMSAKLTSLAEKILRELGGEDISEREKLRIQKKIRKKVRLSTEPALAEEEINLKRKRFEIQQSSSEDHDHYFSEGESNSN